MRIYNSIKYLSISALIGAGSAYAQISIGTDSSLDGSSMALFTIQGDSTQSSMPDYFIIRKDTDGNDATLGDKENLLVVDAAGKLILGTTASNLDYGNSSGTTLLDVRGNAQVDGDLGLGGILDFAQRNNNDYEIRAVNSALELSNKGTQLDTIFNIAFSDATPGSGESLSAEVYLGTQESNGTVLVSFYSTTANDPAATISHNGEANGALEITNTTGTGGVHLIDNSGPITLDTGEDGQGVKQPLILSEYGSGTLAGSSQYYLGVDASGNVTEIAMNAQNNLAQGTPLVQTANRLYDTGNYDLVFENSTTSKAILSMKGATGFVGIGTDSPQVSLDVVGDAAVSGAFDAGTMTLNGPLASATDALLDISVSTSGSTLDIFSAHGDGTIKMPQVYFNTLEAGVSAKVLGVTSSGEIVVTDAQSVGTSGGIRAYFSDERLKENIEPYARGLDFIKQLTPVQYRFTKESGLGQRQAEVGLIAQEVLALAPESVSEIESQGDEANYYGLYYNDFIMALINSVQELDQQSKAPMERSEAYNFAFEKVAQENAALAQENQALRNSNDALLERLEALEARIQTVLCAKDTKLCG